MATLTPADLLERLNWRYAVKEFDATRQIPAPTWATLEAAMVLAPSSFGFQPWKFVVVENTAVRQRLVAASWNQDKVAKSSHLVVFAGRKGLSVADADRHLERVSEVQGAGRDALKGYRDMLVGFVEKARAGGWADAWSARQTYIALGFFLESAAILGIDACPMEGIDPVQYDQILGLDKLGYGSLAAVAVGYRSPNDASAKRPKVRFKAEDVILRV